VPHELLADRPVDEAKSKATVEAGGLPIRAQRRIYELQTSKNPIFTSTLSPSETVVARATGVEAMSQVMGSSVYHVGFGNFGQWQGGELGPLTQAYEQARSRALSRMQQEAMMLRAHAVVDVKFIGRGFEWGADLVEFNAVGTAVRIQGLPVPQYPALTLLKADELYKLHNAGYWPVAIAIGNCFWYEPHCDCPCDGSFYSRELPGHTQVSQNARDVSVQRFRAFAHHFKADGVVGVTVERKGKNREYETGTEHNKKHHTAFNMELVVLGTAVVRRADAGPEAKPARPDLVVDLRDLEARNAKHG